MVPVTLHSMVAMVQQYPLANEPFDGLTIQEPDTEGHQQDAGDEEIKEVLTHAQLPLPHFPVTACQMNHRPRNTNPIVSKFVITNHSVSKLFLLIW